MGFTLSVCKTEFILISLFIFYYIIFYKNNCRPTFAPPCSSSPEGNRMGISRCPIGKFKLRPYGDVGSISKLEHRLD